MRRFPTAAPLRHSPSGAPPWKAMAHPSGAPLRLCGGFQQRHPSGACPRLGYGTPSGATPAHIDLPGHAAAPNNGTRPAPPSGTPLSRAMAHPSGAPSAHIGGLPGHVAVSNSGTPPTYHLRHIPSGAPPRKGYGTPIRHTPPPT